MNDSGRGNTGDLPPEIRGWNWGAFLLNWVWGIGNGTPIALLTWVPCVGFAMPFVLGAKGNEWAWKNRRWQSVDEFKQTQRRWAIVGAVLMGVGLLLTGGMIVSAMTVMKSSEPYVLAETRLRNDPKVAEIFGNPLETGMAMGNLSVSGPAGEAQLSFSVKGPKAKGTAYFNATKNVGNWNLDLLEVEVEGRPDRMRLVPP